MRCAILKSAAVCVAVLVTAFVSIVLLSVAYFGGALVSLLVATAAFAWTATFRSNREASFLVVAGSLTAAFVSGMMFQATYDADPTIPLFVFNMLSLIIGAVVGAVTIAIFCGVKGPMIKMCRREMEETQNRG